MTRPMTFGDGRFTVNRDYYALRLWCEACVSQCPPGQDPSPVPVFFDDLTPLQEINQAAAVHDITEHAEPMGDVSG